MLFSVLSLLLFCSRPLKSQTKLSAKELTRIWLMDSGLFPQDAVKMKAYEEARDSALTYSGYNFAENGEITLVSHNAGKFKFCGNGTPYVKKGTWFYKKGYVRITIDGGYFAAGTYQYDLVYRVASLNNGSLVLKKTKTYKNKRCEHCFK